MFLTRLARSTALAAAPALAGAQVYGTAAAITGSRTGSFLDVGDRYASSFDVAWSVASAGTGLLRYTYTFSGSRRRASATSSSG